MIVVAFGGVRGLMKAAVVSLCVAFSFLAAGVSSAEERTISMYNIHTKDKISITFKKDGRYIPEALEKLNYFMRDWRRNMTIRIDPGLIDLMWELHNELGSKEPIHLICGYRSGGTNELLRRTRGGQARNSRHITGQAADLMFPDVPLKQLRYSALVRERGGVGYYPESGLPFVHVDTGNVRHWPRITRPELAVIFPNGRSKHVPSDGRPLTPQDSRFYLAQWKESGKELPWVVTHKRASTTMLASLVPNEAPLLRRASLSVPDAAPAKAEKPAPKDTERLPASIMRLPETLAKPDSLARDPEELPQIAEEGEEQDDDIAFEPLPSDTLLSEKSLAYDIMKDVPEQAPVFQNVKLLMLSPSAITGEDFDHGLQIEAMYEAHMFKGPAIQVALRKSVARLAAANAGVTQAR
ncbi:DUF882 domain-containing protein [Rhodomicrobium udaipurense]|nr:DUF882 domain-containing protein [Rhodomicrobium udaipurense]